MCLGSMGFEIASKRTSDGKGWIWSTFGTGQGFFADYIIAGTMLADRIYGGTLTLGGRDNKAGIMKILNSSGAVMTTLDKDGILTNEDTLAEVMNLAEEQRSQRVRLRSWTKVVILSGEFLQ